jgi:PKD repeat protein
MKKSNSGWPRRRLCLEFFLAVLCVSFTLLQTRADAITTGPSSTILVDASRDGGVWWFPQAGPFDPKAAHQGKALADFLKSKGATVQELPRPTTINSSLLSGYDIVIRANEYGSYSTAEIDAYHQFVSNGGQLLLLSEYKRPGEKDTLAESFGIQFVGVSSGGNVIDRVVTHPITQNVIKVNYGVGSGLINTPDNSTLLGFLSYGTYLDLNDNDVKDIGEPVGAAALGTMQHGSGTIVFLGDTNALESVPQPITENIYNFFTSKVNSPIISSYTAKPTSGPPPLDVTLKCKAEDPDGSIVEYRWDFGDSEDNTTTTGSTTHTYADVGTFKAKVVVVDNDGAQTTANRILIKVSHGPDLAGSCEEYHFYNATNRIKMKLKVTNNGDMVAPAFKVTFHLSNNGTTALPEFKELSVPKGLAVGKSTVLQVDQTFTESIYGKYIMIFVDPKKQVAEVDETNNGTRIVIQPMATK